MAMGVKPQKKKDEMDFRKVLDTTDPFDQLLMELGKENVLDISVVPLEQNYHPDDTATYNRKILPKRGKHSA